MYANFWFPIPECYHLNVIGHPWETKKSSFYICSDCSNSFIWRTKGFKRNSYKKDFFFWFFCILISRLGEMVFWHICLKILVMYACAFPRFGPVLFTGEIMCAQRMHEDGFHITKPRRLFCNDILIFSRKKSSAFSWSGTLTNQPYGKFCFKDTQSSCCSLALTKCFLHH